ncbi:hypothetical protein ASPCAL14335 [Aspergillus calidoustus]|uniref:DNA 3'-5' helicase n=1 Tax=Aspergillus calidoustus TaxID=454130 RepID=A0A0U5GHS3_ASPCI|nr:hypothetical protein ASPCAL14335 [Aspergillus calidoustus]
MMRRLDRVVVDECYIIMNPQRDFRPEMAQLGQLVRARTQMVYLTATFPPQMEGEFSRRIHYPRDQIYIYRARTSRRNVAYRVWRPAVGSSPYQWQQDPGIIAFMQARIQQARRAGGGKVVIYANAIRQVQAMAEIFWGEAYHSQQVDRAGVLERFIQGTTGVIVATNALGMGVDIPDIRVIIHIGAPRTLLDYAQESGRAGRDGQASEAIIIQPEGMDAQGRGGAGGHHPWEEAEDQDEDQDMEAQRVQRYMQAGGCRRVVLDEYLDGIIDGYERQRCGDAPAEAGQEEQACDRCDPGWQAQHAAGTSTTSTTSSSGSQAVQVRVWKEAPARGPAQATTPPATQPGLGFREDRQGVRPGDDRPASSGSIVSQIRYEPPPPPPPGAEAEAEAAAMAAITPPASAEALGLGIRSVPGSSRPDAGRHEAGEVGPSSLAVVRVPATSS